MSNRTELLHALMEAVSRVSEIGAQLEAIDEPEEVKVIAPEEPPRIRVALDGIDIADDGRVSVKWIDSEPKQHSVWISMRAGEMDERTPVDNQPRAEESVHVKTGNIFQSQPISSGIRTVEVATIAFDPINPKAPDWTATGIDRTYHTIDVPERKRTRSVRGPSVGGVSVEATSGNNVIARSTLTPLKKRIYYGKKDQDLVIEDAIIMLPPNYKHNRSKQDESSVFFAYGYRSVTLRRCLVLAHEYGGTLHRQWRHSAIGVFETDRVVFEDVETVGAHTGIRTWRCKSVSRTRCRITRYCRHGFMDSELQQDPALPQSINDIIRLDQLAPAASRESADNFNAYDCVGTESKPILYQNIWISASSGGPNGSGFVLGDGGDVGAGHTGRPSGYQRASAIVMQNTRNKFFGITGGRECHVDDVWGLQTDPKLGIGHGQGCYVGDYNTPKKQSSPNTTDTKFGNHSITNCRIGYKRPDGSMRPFADWRKGLVSKSSGERIFADQRHSKLELHGNEFDTEKTGFRLTHDECEQRGKLLTQAAIKFA